MIGIIRDIVRAFLVLTVLAVGLELLKSQGPPAAVQNDPRLWQPAQPPYMATVAPPAERPLRRVAGSFVDLADSLLGVIR